MLIARRIYAEKEQDESLGRGERSVLGAIH
jgi:hypothetical protein